MIAILRPRGPALSRNKGTRWVLSCMPVNLNMRPTASASALPTRPQITERTAEAARRDDRSILQVPCPPTARPFSAMLSACIFRKDWGLASGA